MVFKNYHNGRQVILFFFLFERYQLLVEKYSVNYVWMTKDDIIFWFKVDYYISLLYPRTYIERIGNCVYILCSRKLTIAIRVTSRDRKLFILACPHNGGQRPCYILRWTCKLSNAWGFRLDLIELLLYIFMTQTSVSRRLNILCIMFKIIDLFIITLFAMLYMRDGILFWCGGHWQDSIILLRGDALGHRTILTSPCIIKVHVSIQESDLSCIFLLFLSILPLSMIFPLYFVTVSTSWYLCFIFSLSCSMDRLVYN